MRLRRLCKAANSVGQGDCPAVYAADDPAMMVSQGTLLDAVTTAELRDVATDEAAVAIPTETVLRAAGLFLAERGYPAALTEVEAYLTAAVMAERPAEPPAPQQREAPAELKAGA